MSSYNGHKSYNAWNVSLWINNDELLYNLAKNLCRTNNKSVAAQKLFNILKDRCNVTPDGVPWSLTNIRLALRGI